MTIQKNVASQRLHFLMVDATDFATPEPGIDTTNQYCKDNGGWSTCSNTESEINSGLYRITLAATETKAGVVTFKFTGAGCAKQLITIYPEDGYKAGISDILSTLDDPVTDYLSSTLNVAKSIIVDTASILVDTSSTLLNRTTSIVDQVSQILADTGTTLENRTTSIVDQVSQILA